MEFEPDTEEIVWCRAACGNNIHEACFNQWAATKGAQGVCCVYWCVFPGIYLKLSTLLTLSQVALLGRLTPVVLPRRASWKTGVSITKDTSMWPNRWAFLENEVRARHTIAATANMLTILQIIQRIIRTGLPDSRVIIFRVWKWTLWIRIDGGL